MRRRATFAQGKLKNLPWFAGLVQRFSLGFRGPLCLVAGFLGIRPAVFASGVAAGAFGTMALQITAVGAPGRLLGASAPLPDCT